MSKKSDEQKSDEQKSDEQKSDEQKNRIVNCRRSLELTSEKLNKYWVSLPLRYFQIVFIILGAVAETYMMRTYMGQQSSKFNVEQFAPKFVYISIFSGAAVPQNQEKSKSIIQTYAEVVLLFSAQ